MYKSNAVFDELDTSERIPSQRMHSEPGDGQGRYVRYGDSIRWNRFNPVSRSPGTFRPSPPRRLATSPFFQPPPTSVSRKLAHPAYIPNPAFGARGQSIAVHPRVSDAGLSAAARSNDAAIKVKPDYCMSYNIYSYKQLPRCPYYAQGQATMRLCGRTNNVFGPWS